MLSFSNFGEMSQSVPLRSKSCPIACCCGSFVLGRSKCPRLRDADALAGTLRNERQRQHLSREQLAAVSGVSPSFIRDAESRPGACSFGKLLELVQGLGLTLAVHGTTPAAEVTG